MMDVQLLRYSQIVESCLGILRSIVGHAQVLSVVATEDAGKHIPPLPRSIRASALLDSAAHMFL